MKNNLCNIVKFEYKIPSSGNQWKDIFIDVDDAPVKGNHFIAAVTSVENYDISHDGNLSQGGRVVVHVREKGSKTYSEYSLGSTNFKKLAKFCPCPQLWHLKNISFFTL